SLELAIGTKDLLHQLLVPLVELAVVQLVDRRLRSGPLAPFEPGQDAQARVAQYLDLDRHATELLAHERLVETPEPATHLHRPLEIRGVACHPRQDVPAALVAQRGLGQLPALADAADQVFGWHPDV